jgi:GH25 family lysozyme M1 (1,4-beta-N-acetylmuramidase)
MQTRSATDVYGVDLSAYQGNVDWGKMKAKNVRFAILRAYGTDHSGTGDANFERYVAEARTNGIPTGAYYFATPTPPLDLNQARTQAQQFIDKLQKGFGAGNFGELLPFVDIEHNPNATAGKNITDLGKANLITWILEFRRYFQEKTNKVLGIYCNEWFMKDPTHMAYTDEEMKPLAVMPLWVAEFEKYWGTTRIQTNPAPNNFGGWTSYNAWQFSENGSGTEYGVSSTAIDLDVTKDIALLMSKDVVVTEAPATTEPAPTTPTTDTTDPTGAVAPETETVLPSPKEERLREIMTIDNIVEVWECETLIVDGKEVERTTVYIAPNA